MVPFGPSYALAMAHEFPDPVAFIARIDRLLMFLGRYGHQDADRMQRHVPMVTISSWARELNELLERENPQPGA